MFDWVLNTILWRQSLNNNDATNPRRSSQDKKYSFNVTIESIKRPQTLFSTPVFFYKQFIFDPRPKNCLSFPKKLPQKIV